jgi:hypothetical protein
MRCRIRSRLIASLDGVDVEVEGIGVAWEFEHLEEVLK